MLALQRLFNSKLAQDKQGPIRRYCRCDMYNYFHCCIFAHRVVPDFDVPLLTENNNSKTI